MGLANSIASNQVDKPFTIMTFNNVDFAYQKFKILYFVAPWGESQVDYGVVGDQMLYRMWGCGNGSTLMVNSIVMIKLMLPVKNVGLANKNGQLCNNE
jgi:hypothetical protein